MSRKTRSMKCPVRGRQPGHRLLLAWLRKQSSRGLLHALARGRGQSVAAAAAVGLGLADRWPQRLAVHTEIPRDVGDRPVILEDQPNATFCSSSRTCGGLASPKASCLLSQVRSSWLRGLHRWWDGSSPGAHSPVAGTRTPRHRLACRPSACHADELHLLVVAAHRLLLDVAHTGDVVLALRDARV